MSRESQRSISNLQQYGIIEVGPLQPMAAVQNGRAAGQAAIRVRQITWRPAPAIKSQLPPNCTLEFEEMMVDGESRRLRTAGNVDEFLLTASLAGHAILEHQNRLDRETSFSYHTMRLVGQLAGRLQENLQTYQFRRQRDLFISARGSNTVDDTTVLPDDVVARLKGRCGKAHVAAVLDRGRKAASRHGIRNPDPATVIRLGLRDLAEEMPVPKMKSADVSRFLRVVLFDLGPSEDAVSNDTRVLVEARLLSALEQHIKDPTEEFDRWFYQNFDGVVHQIAKQKRNGGAVPREIVRQVALENVFNSLEYLGGCITAIMTTIAESLPTALSQKDREIFDFLYVGQVWLGSVPLILLHNQFDWLHEILIELSERPTDPELQSQLLLMLRFHADMVRKKRGADRRRKQRSSATDRNHPIEFVSTGQVNQAEARDTFDSDATSILRNHVELLRSNRNARCRCADTNAWKIVLTTIKNTGTDVSWEEVCERCGHKEPVTCSTGMLQRLVEEISE